MIVKFIYHIAVLSSVFVGYQIRNDGVNSKLKREVLVGAHLPRYDSLGHNLQEKIANDYNW